MTERLELKLVRVLEGRYPVAPCCSQNTPFASVTTTMILKWRWLVDMLTFQVLAQKVWLKQSARIQLALQ
jgi:hypothetical protein